MNGKQFIAEYKEELLSILVLLITSLISFGTFNSKILMSDEWSNFVARYAFGELHPFYLTHRRPLYMFGFYAMASFFGLKLEYYYFLNFLILFFSALLVYLVLRRVFPGYGWLSSLVAIVYLVYPVDYTRTWIIMMQIRFIWLISLGVIWLLIEFAKSGKKWMYLFAMLGTILPLGGYEGQFGIIVLASFLISLFASKVTIKRRFLIFGSILAIDLSFVLFRIFIQSNVLGIDDTYIETMQFDPAIIFERYIQGLEVFSTGWIIPIQAQLELLHINTTCWFWLYCFFFGAAYLWMTLKTTPDARLQVKNKKSILRSLGNFFLTGGAFWIAGYIPIIALFTPSLNGNASRVNMYAIAGASMMFVSAVAIIATLFSKSTFQMQVLLAAIISVFVIAGVFVQRQINIERQIVWEAQKSIWNGVFKTIPNIQDGKTVVIIIPGYEHQRPLQSRPFIAFWEVNSGAQVLYNNPNIGGSYYYKDVQNTETHFTQYGYKQVPTDKIESYKKLVFLTYDPNTRSTTLVENIETELSLSFNIHNYAPDENIAPYESSIEKYRWLVK